MKKFRVLVVTVLSLAIISVLSIGVLAWNDGTYTGTADGHNGPLTVEVVVVDGKISAIEVVEHSETPGLFDHGLTVRESIIAEQSLTVDSVSGATVSSKAIIAAVQNALGFQDGTYTGKGQGFKSEIVVEVEVKDGKIASITIVSQDETPVLSDAAYEAIPEAIIAAQSTDVDTVSGATGTSKGIIAAVNDALGL